MDQPTVAASRRFADRVAVVTGGGRGIGAATARRFAADGAAVVVCDRDIEPAEVVADEVGASGGTALAVGVDVSDSASVAAMFRAAVARFGQVDYLVTCAGIIRFNRVQDISDTEWDEVVDIQLKGTFLCARSACEYMVPRRSGRMVFMSSGAASGHPNRAHYSAAKAGIEALTKVFAMELGEHNINVNAVSPGLVDTRMPEQHAQWLGEDYATFGARIAAGTPLRRNGTPEEQASVITFLCSDDAAFMTGEVVHVSGGR